MGRLLLIVSRDKPDVYRYLTWHLSSEKDAQVIFDRRQRTEPRPQERRRVDRLRQAGVKRDLLSLNHVITLEEEPEPRFDVLQVGHPLP